MRTDNFTDKASRNPEELKLYEENDYITAYSLHTDLRIERDGYQAAIGSNDKPGQGWEEHGKQQLNFLISQGLRPEHMLLDFGCGTGRLACQAVPYLNKNKYTGIDISPSAIEVCKSRDWGDKDPLFVVEIGGLSSVVGNEYNLIWAHSVLTHLPEKAIEGIFFYLERMAFGKFLFTYKHHDEPRRSGLKQFQYPFSYFSEMAKQHGLTATDMNITWPAGQRTVCVRR